MHPKVIGLILNYRDPDRTRCCVESLLAEGVDQIIIWDNSEDNGSSVAVLRQKLMDEPGILVHQSLINRGFAAGVNRGLALIQKRYPNAWVLLINNDAVLLPGSLALLYEALTSYPQAVLAYPTIDHNGRILGTTYYHRILALITTSPLPGSFPYASGCCQLIAPERYPGMLYDEDFFMYGEDAELGWRLGPRRMVHVPSARVRHEGSATSHPGSLFYETHLIASHWLLVRKLSRSLFDHYLMQIGRVFSLGVRAIIRSFRYHSMTPLQALLTAARVIQQEHP